MSMKNARNYWSSHLAAIKTQGVATSEYASQHGISLTSLYYWRSKLLSESLSPLASAPVATEPKPQSKFVTLRVGDAVPEMSASLPCCTLVWSGGMRLEMSALPDPLWLAAVGRANQVVH
jgi:transposase-like protein